MNMSNFFLEKISKFYKNRKPTLRKIFLKNILEYKVAFLLIPFASKLVNLSQIEIVTKWKPNRH